MYRKDKILSNMQFADWIIWFEIRKAKMKQFPYKIIKYS